MQTCCLVPHWAIVACDYDSGYGMVTASCIRTTRSQPIFKLFSLVHVARNKVGCDEQHPHLTDTAVNEGALVTYCYHYRCGRSALSWAADAMQDERRERQELDCPDLGTFRSSHGTNSQSVCGLWAQNRVSADQPMSQSTPNPKPSTPKPQTRKP